MSIQITFSDQGQEIMVSLINYVEGILLFLRKTDNLIVSIETGLWDHFEVKPYSRHFIPNGIFLSAQRTSTLLSF